MNPLDNPLVFAVACFGSIGPVLGLGILIPNTGVILAKLFALVFGEQIFAKVTGQQTGSVLIDPNELDEFKEQHVPQEAAGKEAVKEGSTV